MSSCYYLMEHLKNTNETTEGIFRNIFSHNDFLAYKKIQAEVTSNNHEEINNKLATIFDQYKNEIRDEFYENYYGKDFNDPNNELVEEFLESIKGSTVLGKNFWHTASDKIFKLRGDYDKFPTNKTFYLTHVIVKNYSSGEPQNVFGYDPRYPSKLFLIEESAKISILNSLEEKASLKDVIKIGPLNKDRFFKITVYYRPEEKFMLSLKTLGLKNGPIRGIKFVDIDLDSIEFKDYGDYFTLFKDSIKDLLLEDSKEIRRDLRFCRGNCKGCIRPLVRWINNKE